ncbi:MAG: aromatic ring-hydroxylating dioxygenase subunit alpha [Woeseia sp.]
MEATLHRDLYLEPSWFAREREKIFFDQWTCVGREEDLTSAGSYEAVELAGESIIIVRGEDGTLRAFYNVCRHRGCQLIDTTKDEQKRGKFPGNIRCPYHSWSYRLDGALHHTPYVNVDTENLGLHRARLDTWGGFIFVNLADGDSIVTEQLGPIAERVIRYPLDQLRAGWSCLYRVAANWKVILENYNECYHCGGVHPELCKIVPDFRRNGGAHLDWEEGVPQKPGTNTFTSTGTTKRKPFPGLNEAERERHFGELIYPNLMISLAMDHVAMFILFPVGPELTLIDCRLLFHPEAFEQPDYDPGDAADFWDLVNGQDWAICERVQRGMHARPFTRGLYAPMEDLSLDIRSYIAARLGTDAVTG